MTSAQRPSIFTVPVHRAFADSLVAGLMRTHGGDPLGLAAGMILLPNNRAVTAVRDAFIRHSGGALLLPRLVALGDEDIDDSVGAALDRIEPGEEPLPPAIPAMQRRFLLAQMIADHRPGTPVGEAVRLADALAHVFDVLAIEEVSVAQLERVKHDAAMPDHWEDAFRLLQLLAHLWPAELARLGMIDRSARRNALYIRLAQRWRKQGLPSRFVVAAGITTTAPVVARLLKVVATSEGGAVVLPHLDATMPDDWWASLGDDPADEREGASPPLDSHPYLHLKLLLHRMDMRREDVVTWPDDSDVTAPAHRNALVRNLFAPAPFTAEWLGVRAPDRRVDGITHVDCATSAEEALTIALAMREVLEHPGRTAALVTPDRAIATRVAGHLARWGIEADDSAGQPLATSPAGELALALADAVSCQFLPIQLIALLSHPYVASADKHARQIWMDRVRELDLVLRGPRPASGLAKLEALLAEGASDKDASDVARARANGLLMWWRAEVMPMLVPLADAIDHRDAALLPTVLAMLRQGLSDLTGEQVWTGAAGRALAGLLENVEGHAALLNLPMDRRELVPLLRQLMRDVAVRPPQGGHPRLFIWGLIEGRLQRADRMILAGLNEGQWPQRQTPDPWLPPVVRRELGLPGLERPVGLAAHDFASALGAGEVIITRAQREGSAPTVASRLVLRLSALVGEEMAKGEAQNLVRVASALDGCTQPQPMARPMFRPAAAMRPKRLSVTEVDTLLADPFAFYARNALGLNPLDPLDAEPTAAWRGTMVHDVLEQWLLHSNGSSEAIAPLIEQLLERPGVNPVLRALWAPRLRPPLIWAAEAIVADQRELDRQPIADASEIRGEIPLDGGVILSGRPDRIDRLADGTLVIVDYKTGSGPAKNAVEKLFALQLGLLGLIAQQGGFPAAVGTVSQFEYWRMNRATSGSRGGQFGWTDTPFKKTKDAAITAENYVERAQARLNGAVTKWLIGDEPFKAKLRPEFAIYSDYDHLMRLEEWYGREASRDVTGAADE